MERNKVITDKAAEKFLKKFANENPQMSSKIHEFIKVLREAQNPLILPNAKRLKGFDDVRYRWRINDYRIIAKIENGKMLIIRIVKIAHRKDAYK